jgi:GR25 family glycosyltransferase involved in LPS biosynthesis
MRIDQYFDKIYVLNLHRRPERREEMKRRLAFAGVENYEFFGATDGAVMRKIWESHHRENSSFVNSNYLACAVSHLAIYHDAVTKNYGRILVLEDDVRIRRDLNTYFSSAIKLVPEDWNELLYLGFIPLSDDCSRWDYNVFADKFINSNVFVAKNLWGLYSYGISSSCMMRTLDWYEENFPMEIDRYFVQEVQPMGSSYAITPQMFCAEDGVSDNSHKNEKGMMERSVDTRFAKLTDYV